MCPLRHFACASIAATTEATSITAVAFKMINAIGISTRRLIVATSSDPPPVNTGTKIQTIQSRVATKAAIEQT